MSNSSSVKSPGLLITRLNKWLCRNVPITKFISLVCLCLEATDSDRTHVSYANAGHCPPLLIRRNGSVEHLKITGGVLGVHEDFVYEEQELTLSSGDSLALFTDGIVEAENSDGEFYGEDRLVELIQTRPEDSIKGITGRLINSVRDFTGNSPVDDTTAIILRKK